MRNEAFPITPTSPANSRVAVRAATNRHEEKHLTTSQAPEVLAMSRPSLIRLIDSGGIPFDRVGKRRRLALRDVLACERHRNAARRRALNKIARAAFVAGLYDNNSIPDGGQDA